MIDHEKVEQAVRLLLEGIGEDVNREGLIDTPDRIARMYEEIYGGTDVEKIDFPGLKLSFHPSEERKDDVYDQTLRDPLLLFCPLLR